MSAIPAIRNRSPLTNHRFFLLFVLLLGMLLLHPYAGTSRAGSYAFRVIGSAAIFISVYAAKIHRSLLIIALILAVPTVWHRHRSQRSVERWYTVQVDG